MAQYSDPGFYYTCDPGSMSISNMSYTINQLIKDPKPTMYQKFVNLFLTEPEKSFRNAEITDARGDLTSQGKDILLAWLLKKNADAFLTEVVTPLLAEEAKK